MSLIDHSELSSPVMQTLIDDMIETMVEYKGVGLAAPQVHQGLRLFVASLDSDGVYEPDLSPTVSPETVDRLFEKAMRETNDSLRYKLYQQADQVMINDAPVVPLWYDMVIHLVQPNVKGFQPNALNLLELRRVKIE